MDENVQTQPKMVRLAGLLAAPIIAAVLLMIGAPETMAAGAHIPDAWVVLILVVVMAIWWITEAIPIPVTSLLPLVVLPMASIRSVSETAAPYMHPVVVLLMGGFIFAKAIENWGLHERIALNVVSRSSSSPAGLIGGFMFASAALSMWISNTATSIMMMPIAISVAAAIGQPQGERNRNFLIALLLGIAYGCSIGGLATPIGTPTNLIVIGYLNDYKNLDIGFYEWMMLGLPSVVVLLPMAWWCLTKWSFRMPTSDTADAKNTVIEKLSALGTMTAPERRTLGLFVFIAGLWVFKRPLNTIELTLGDTVFSPFSGLTDQVTAILAVILCFLIPSGAQPSIERPAAVDDRSRLLNWKVAESIPWGVLLLFGGGLSLATAISSTGLSAYIGSLLSPLTTLPAIIVVFGIAALVLALTELTSNVATASALMPVLIAIAMATGFPIELMAAPLALAASCAFMLPLATGPNAVAFSTGAVSIPEMARAGFRVNLIALVVISLAGYFLAPLALS